MAVNFAAATKAPPVKSSRRGMPPVVETPRSVRELREDGLNGLGQVGQGLLLAIKQYADAATVGIHWGNITPELAKLADQYEVLAKPIDLLIQIGPFGALIGTLLPFAAQLAANHRFISPGAMNTAPPEMLSAQMQTQLAKMQAEMLKAQKAAMEELKTTQEELDALARGFSE